MNCRHPVRRCFVLLAAAAFTASSAAAQTGASLQIGRLFESDGWTSWRFALDRPLAGPIGGRLVGTALIGPDAVGEKLWGAGGELTFFRDGRGPYGVGGVAGGFGTGASGKLWGSWSAGAGYDFALAPWASLGGEARWQALSFEHRHGPELSFGLSLRFGGGSPPRSPPVLGPSTSPSRSPVEPRVAAGASAAAVARADSGARSSVGGAAPEPSAPASASLTESIVATATEMMGKPYEYGGEGEGSDGFDCSGLIQYAYAQHGVLLPRRSVDQAKQGRAVERRLDALEPGDILTFSNKGGPITHVGMYVGGGKFIHSATHGVQQSVLSPDDPYGRWWYARWIGARRVVP